MESDGHTRSTSGVRELRQPPVRRSVGQRAAAARRPTSIVCWWRTGDAGGAEDRRRAAGADGPPRGSVRPTRHSTTLAATRRHPCRPEMVAADCAWFRSRPKSVVAPDGTERSAEKGRRLPQWRQILAPVDLTRAKSSCARGAPSQRRRSAERPTFNWSAERPAIRPTRWRRLGGASAISFLGRERSIDHAAAAGRALGPTGYRQTGGTERSALSCPVDLTRAESSCARGAPSQRRRSAERPTFSWSAERPAIRPTRWRRLGGASAISFLGRERSIMLPPPAARWVLRGIAKQAALKDQRYRGRVPPLYPITRAREVDSATRWGRHLAAAANSILVLHRALPDLQRMKLC